MFNNYTNPYVYTGLSNGGYNGYNPNQYYNPFPQQNGSQQNQQPQSNPQPTSVTNTNKIYVSGIDDVKGRFLSPNSDVLFIDNDKPLLYQKVVDSKGQFEIKVFDICPHIEQKEEVKDNSIDLSAYVLKSDLEPLQAEIKGLNDKITKMSIQKQIDSIKRDDIKPLKKPNEGE